MKRPALFRLMRPRAPDVLMLGPALEAPGGVPSVIQTYLQQGLFDRWRVDYLATHGTGTNGRKLFRSLAALWRLSLRMAERPPAFVHMHFAPPASFWRQLVLFAATRLASVPVVLHLHGGGIEDFQRRASGSLARVLMRWMLESSEQVLALSPHWLRLLERIAPRARVALLPNPVAAAGDDPTQTSSEMREPIEGRIVFLAPLSAQKGVFDLLEAFARVRPAHPHAHLVLAGPGAQGPVRARVRRLQLGTRVQLLAWPSAAERARLLDSAAVFALPSFVEGLPVAVLEAMARGVPVVATPVGGVPDVLGHEAEGLLVPPGDVLALASALHRLLSDPATAAAMGERGRARSRAEFDAEAVCGQLDRLYSRLVLANGAPA